MKANLAWIVVVSGLVMWTGHAETLPVVKKAASLTFKVSGGQQKALDEFKGKVIALEFIQTTCPHCQAASKVMTQMQHEFGPRGFQAIDLAINTANEADITAFQVNQQTDFLVGWTDFAQMGSFLGLKPGMRFLVPQVVLIDRGGNIRYQTPQSGDEAATELDTMRQRLASLMTERAK